ncbi:DUF262 domain-containing protein [Desulfobotulus sp.]|uniref:DUF262 domain-containing protein n=1 Tax=Desulfobotulus sp. TaxID=1940337 RepID=UPI002A371144|nr:DUF262 domain-containing protein [Desulfobotulus sp.]MDY0162067.1 DUF262 domain-containing protein [Desulfobotulus sp.]
MTTYRIQGEPMAVETESMANEDTFEGEETLGAELREKNSSPESDTAEIYPDALVNIAAESTSVFQLKRKYDKEPPLIKLDPDFQRHTVWTAQQKSELIESILMGIPLPLIYVKEDDRGVHIVVDGRQRLTTLFQFMNHEFPLQKLTILKDLNGSYFSESTKNGTRFSKHLSQAQQTKIEDCQLTLHIIKPPTQDRVTFDLFDRVNRGGTRLNNQEMRNAIYQGAATKLLNHLVALDSFKLATENSVKSDRMKDKYLVLRMIAFYLWRKKKLLAVKEPGFPPVDYRSDMEDFLGKTMLFLNHPKGGIFCSEFPPVFDKLMQACKTLLGKGCFRLPKAGNGPRRPINMALFETVSYFILEVMDQPIEKHPLIKKSFETLLVDEEFLRCTSYTVDSKVSINHRFESIEKKIQEIRND